MARKRRTRKRTRFQAEMPVIHPHAAGIDIGATEVYVAVPPDRDPRPVRCFQTFTQDLYALADWLQACGIDTVAMESTGVYWVPLFQILEDRGIQVYLVNARHVKNVPGRKSDVSDCQWLQYLHAVGLLRGSFRPAQDVCALRSLLRHRESLVQMASQHVQHVHKALDQMNLQIHHILSDVTGMTGLAILDAILAGECDPHILARIRFGHLKADQATVAKALVGDYRLEHLFTLRQSLAAYRYIQQQISECDHEIQRYVARLEKEADSQFPSDSHPPAPQTTLDLSAELHRLFGTDLTKVPGLDLRVLQTLLGEVGPDFSKFPSGPAFACWLALCPHNDTSGGKVLRARTRRIKNRTALALRLAAQSLHHNQSHLGQYYRRLRARLGAPKAITATAHKLARIIYHLVTTGETYDESIFAKHEARYQQRLAARLRAQARTLGFQLVPLQA